MSKEGAQKIEAHPAASSKAAASVGEAVDWSKLPGGKPLSQVLAEQQEQGKSDLVKDIFGVDKGQKRRGSVPFGGLKPFGAKKPDDAPHGDHAGVSGVKWSDDVVLNERGAGPRSPPSRLDTAGSKSSSRPESRQKETLMTDLDEESLEGAQQEQQQQQGAHHGEPKFGRRINFSFGKKKDAEVLEDACDEGAAPQLLYVQPEHVPLSKVEPFPGRRKGGMRPF